MNHESPVLPDTRPPASVVEQVCAHLDLASRQLAVGDADVFSPRITLAGQLSLLQADMQPGLRAVPRPDADGENHCDALQHLDRALALLEFVPFEGAPSGRAPDDLTTWTARLVELRPAVRAACSSGTSSGWRS